MIKAIIFDLDGTLLDTVDSMAYSCNKALNFYGFSSIDRENYKYFAGDGAEMLVKRALKYIDVLDDSNFNNVFNKYKEYFQIYCTYNVKVYDGIRKLIENLKQKDIKIAVLSNKPHERTIDVVKCFFGEDTFDEIQGQLESRRKKPFSDGANFIIDKFKVNAEECLLVGDTSVDMKTGKEANMRTIGVLWGFRTKDELIENGAWKIVKNPLEIVEIIGKDGV